LCFRLPENRPTQSMHSYVNRALRNVKDRLLTTFIDKIPDQSSNFTVANNWACHESILTADNK
jgi:hypothetical protein